MNGIVSRVFVIGPCGAGKSTASRAAAESLPDKIVYCDLDQWVSEYYGVSAVAILNKFGPATFVDRCREAVEHLLVQPGKLCLVDVGGGAWMAPDKLAEWLRKEKTISICVPPQVAFFRKGQKLFGDYQRFLKEQYSEAHATLLRSASYKLEFGEEPADKCVKAFRCPVLKLLAV